MSFYVYILASRRNGTLYIGMTDDLARRTWQHRVGVVPGFTKTYSVTTLVWYEVHETRASAFTRERQLKRWEPRLEIAAHRAHESDLARSVGRPVEVSSGSPLSRGRAGATPPPDVSRGRSPTRVSPCCGSRPREQWAGQEAAPLGDEGMCGAVGGEPRGQAHRAAPRWHHNAASASNNIG